MDAPTIAVLADLYLLRCEVEGKSPRTVKAYRETVARFLRSLPGEVVQPEQVQADHIYVYLGAYTEHSLETRHRYFREVRCFFNWLVELDYLVRNPFRGLKNVRLPQRIVEPFSGEEIEALLEACGDGPMAARDRALLFVLLEEACAEVGRDTTTLHRSLDLYIDATAIATGVEPSPLAPYLIGGSHSTIAEQLLAFGELGIDEVRCYLLPWPTPDSRSEAIESMAGIVEQVHAG